MYYAWIPVLGNGVPLYRPDELEFAQLEDSSNYESILQEYCGWTEPLAGWRLRHMERPLDDIDKSRYFPVDFLMDANEKPRFILIWSCLEQDGGIVLASAAIEDFDLETAMFKFSVQVHTHGEDLNEELLPGQVYKIVRSIYHKHVWTGGDFGVLPVKAHDGKEAAKKIWRQYFCRRIITEKKLLLRNAYFTTNRADPEVWHLLLKMCASSIGELGYAKALATLFDLGEEYRMACRRARDSFENIRQLLDSKRQSLQWHYEAKASDRTHWWAIVAVGVAVFFVCEEFSDKPYLSLLVAFSITLVSGFASLGRAKSSVKDRYPVEDWGRSNNGGDLPGSGQ